jgi:hypothetical protein
VVNRAVVNRAVVNRAVVNRAVVNTPPQPRPAAQDPVDDERSEDLCWAVGLVEDWLLHASDEALDELADFAYGPPPHHGRRRLRWIIELLGDAALRLRPAAATSTLAPPWAPPSIIGQGSPR